jgi:hypothetical protein
MRLTSTDFVFNPDDFRDAKFIDGGELDSDQLNDGEVIIAVDRLALTANTISYGIAGKSGLIRYLESFPTDAPYARMPFWGFGDIVASAHPDLPVGERLYGFYPLSTYLLCQMDHVSAVSCRDMTSNRASIPGFYSDYARATAEPGYALEFDDIQSLLRPVISTSFLLESYLMDHDFYNTRNIIITSASSKTAFGFGHFLVNKHSDKCRAIGLTSASNKAFVEKTGCYHQVLTYDEVDQLPLESATVFDMAGNAQLRQAIHQRLGDHIAYSGIVGATHWDAGGVSKNLPGPRPVFWSGPDQIARLEKKLGSTHNILNEVQGQVLGLILETANWLEISQLQGEAEITSAYRDMLDGKVGAETGLIFCAKGGF